MKSTKKIRLALVHDDFIQFGGAERLFFEIVTDFQKDENFEVTVFSSLISKEWKGIFAKDNIQFKESFLAKIPFCYKFHKLFFIFDLFYFAFLDFDFDSFDVVFSSSTRFGHSVLTKPHTYHISYINSPARALWEERKYFYGKKFFYFLLKNILPNKRVYDFYSQNYADLIISNSKNIKKKILKNYSLNSIILYPFIDDNSIKASYEVRDEFYFLISRLVSWKRIDYVIETFNENKLPLLVVGLGPELERYKKITSSNIKFLGYINDEDKNRLYKRAKAMIFPQNEDFGLTILEALKNNCPVVYFKKGGALEILSSKLGVSFDSQDVESLKIGLNKLDSFILDPNLVAKKLKSFEKNFYLRFLKKIIYHKQSQKNCNIGII